MNDFNLDALSQRYTAVEFLPPDISIYAEGNIGIPYVWSFEAENDGPHVVISGCMHGNEIAGAAIIDQLLREEVRPSHGRLTLIFGNPDAYIQFNPEKPYLGRFVDVDINRVWGHELFDPDNTEVEVERARELRSVIEEADYLLDLHTMQGRGEAVALVAEKPATMAFVSRMTSLPFILSGKMHLAHRVRLRGFGRFGDVNDPAVALQVEAGQHWERAAIDTGLEIVYDFLATAGVLPREEVSSQPAQKQLSIVETVMPEGGEFTFADDFHSGTFFPEKGTVVGYSGPNKVEVCTPVDDCYLIMPVHFRLEGGSCCRFAVEST